jgi:antimicrobial peptide system SdpB family protein
MLTRIIQRVDVLIGRLAGIDPWTNVYGTARSLLALSTLLTLAFTSEEVLFKPALDIENVPVCVGLGGRLSLFCLLEDRLTLARWIAIGILVVVLSGWRPRITGLLHWWVCVSLVNSVLLIDGGDHVTLVLSFLLLPIALTDPRRSHFARRPRVEEAPRSPGEAIRRLVAVFAHLAIRFQLAVLYLHAAFAKCGVPEWQNGTAIYYWLVDPQYGAAEWLQPMILPLLRLPYVLTPVTWGVIALEFALFAGLLAERRYRPILLAAGLSLHLAIAVMHGLISFSLAMAGALILFLRPLDREFTADWIEWVRRSLRARESVNHSPAVSDVSARVRSFMSNGEWQGIHQSQESIRENS